MNKNCFNSKFYFLTGENASFEYGNQARCRQFILLLFQHHETWKGELVVHSHYFFYWLTKFPECWSYIHDNSICETGCPNFCQIMYSLWFSISWELWNSNLNQQFTFFATVSHLSGPEAHFSQVQRSYLSVMISRFRSILFFSVFSGLLAVTISLIDSREKLNCQFGFLWTSEFACYRKPQ